MADGRRVQLYSPNASQRLKNKTPTKAVGNISIDEFFGLGSAFTRRPLMPAGNRMNLAQGLSSGINRMVSSKIKRRNGRKAVANIRARFVNWYVSGSNIEVGNTADLTVTASIEYPVGVFHQIKVAGAASFAVSRLVDFVETDPLGIVIPPNADYFFHTWADAGNANNYPVGTAQGRAALDGYESGASVTDKTMVGGESGGASNSYGPAIVYGETLGVAPCVLITGNSVAVGNNDRTSSTGDAFGNAGYLERLLGPAGFNIINFGIPSTQASQIVTLGSYKRRMALLSGITVTSIVNEWGINDITNGRTLAQLLADQGTINTMLSAICSNIIMDTLTPKTAGSWADLAGQSIADATKEGIRVGYNTAIRAGQITLQTGMLDPASVAETGFNSGFWNFAGGPWTDDGTHQISLGAQLIAAGLPATAFY